MTPRNPFPRKALALSLQEGFLNLGWSPQRLKATNQAEHELLFALQDAVKKYADACPERVTGDASGLRETLDMAASPHAFGGTDSEVVQ